MTTIESPPKVATPADAGAVERMLLLELAKHVMGYDDVAEGARSERVERIRRHIAALDAPRVFVCRAHGRQFSSSTPCPACASKNDAVSFLVEAEISTYHVVLRSGRTACGEILSGILCATVGPGHASLCGRCTRALPADVWNRTLDRQKES